MTPTKQQLKDSMITKGMIIVQKKCLGLINIAEILTIIIT